MDKIDMLLFAYKMQRERCKELRRALSVPMILMLLNVLIDIIAIFGCTPRCMLIILVLSTLLLLALSQIMTGKLGTDNWKYKMMKIHRDKFARDQKTLLAVIENEKMDCYKVYDLMIKKYDRIPKGTDRRSYIISLAALVAVANSFLPPISIVTTHDYLKYIIVVIITMVLVSYVVVSIVNILSKDYDAKVRNYEYTIKLLEDCLSNLETKQAKILDKE